MALASPADIRQAALELLLQRELVDRAALGSGDLAGLVAAGLFPREDAQRLLAEAEILLTGRFPEFHEQATAVAGTPADRLAGGNGLYPWKDLGRYRPEVYLGEGGMGRVFRVRDTRLNRVVALKFFRSHPSLGADAFLREVQAQARIDHPNVARVFEAGEQEGIPFLSVQMIQGPTLASAAAGLDLRAKVDAVRQAALGVHAAHRLGIVHRDLKPGNIMLEPDGKDGWKALVMDFGLARDLAEAPGRTTAIMGTPAYMSPEQIEGPQVLVGPHSDIYALGVTLFELLAGRLPFAGATQAELLRSILDREPPRLRALDPSLPAELEAVIQHCMDRDVLRRYDSAEDLAADLERWLAGAPVSVKPASALARLSRGVRRNPLPAASAAAVLLLAGGWAGYAFLAGARVRALDERMQAERADLARLRSELERLRAAREEELRRAQELGRKVETAASPAERKDAEEKLQASLARERDLTQKLLEVQAKGRGEPIPAARPAEPAPLPAAAAALEPAKPVAVLPDATFIPPQVVRQAVAAYPARALTSPQNPHRGKDVTVRIQVQVDAAGKATAASVLEGIAGPWGYNEAALSAGMDAAFAPAQRGGQAVPGNLELRVRFVPPRR